MCQLAGSQWRQPGDDSSVQAHVCCRSVSTSASMPRQCISGQSQTCCSIINRQGLEDPPSPFSTGSSVALRPVKSYFSFKWGACPQGRAADRHGHAASRRTSWGENPVTDTSACDEAGTSATIAEICRHESARCHMAHGASSDRTAKIAGFLSGPGELTERMQAQTRLRRAALHVARKRYGAPYLS
jgi:hypothetical protein